jgi:hypothetical protein
VGRAAYKATFALSATVPAAQMAVSNMPAAASTALGDGRKRVRFADLAEDVDLPAVLRLGDFERAAHARRRDRDWRGHAARHAAQAKFALDASGDVLREYNDYFGVRYPLPKLDNVAGRRAAASSSARWKTGARSSPSNTRCCSIPAISTQRTSQERLRGGRARDRAPVVRRPGDDALVGRPVAQRRLRVVDGKPHDGAPASRSGTRNWRSVGGREARWSATRWPPRTRSCSTSRRSSRPARPSTSITYKKGEAVIRMLEALCRRRCLARRRAQLHAGHAYGNTVSDDLWRAVEKRPRTSRSRRSPTTSRCSRACR